MDQVFAKARAMGATDAAIVRWLDRKITGLGSTPRELIAAGSEDIVMRDLERMREGVFS